MKKIITTLFALLALNSYAEPQRLTMQVVCDKAIDVLSYLETKYEELPLFVSKVYSGDKVSGTLILMVNKETKTWTNVIMNLDGSTACVVASGMEYTIN
jgi:hypothetical protein